MNARVFVTLKQEVLDPQGDAIRHALHSLGHPQVKSVRVGKVIDIELADAAPSSADKALRDMCDRLLANPIIEDANFEVGVTSPGSTAAPSDHGSGDIGSEKTR